MPQIRKSTPRIGKFTSASSRGQVKKKQAGGRLPAPAALHEESTRASDISLVALQFTRRDPCGVCRKSLHVLPVTTTSIFPSTCKCQTGDEVDVMRLRVLSRGSPM